MQYVKGNPGIKNDPIDFILKYAERIGSILMKTSILWVGCTLLGTSLFVIFYGELIDHFAYLFAVQSICLGVAGLLFYILFDHLSIIDRTAKIKHKHYFRS